MGHGLSKQNFGLTKYNRVDHPSLKRAFGCDAISDLCDLVTNRGQPKLDGLLATINLSRVICTHRA